jgi:hypothetical protein
MVSRSVTLNHRSVRQNSEFASTCGNNSFAVAAGGKRLRVDIYASENVIITTKEREVEIVPKYDKTE